MHVFCNLRLLHIRCGVQDWKKSRRSNIETISFSNDRLHCLALQSFADCAVVDLARQSSFKVEIQVHVRMHGLRY